MSGLLISGILNTLCFDSLKEGKKPHPLAVLNWGLSLLTFLEPDDCCSTQEPLQHQNMGSFATCSLPIFKGGLWFTAVHQFCAMWLLCHMSCCFLSSFPLCPESFSLVIWRGKKPSTLSIHILMVNFPAWILLRCRLWIHTWIFCNHEQPGQETMICKKWVIWASRFVAYFILLADYVALSWLCRASHGCSPLLEIWVTYC